MPWLCHLHLRAHLFPVDLGSPDRLCNVTMPPVTACCPPPDLHGRGCLVKGHWDCTNLQSPLFPSETQSQSSESLGRDHAGRSHSFRSSEAGREWEASLSPTLFCLHRSRRALGADPLPPVTRQFEIARHSEVLGGLTSFTSHRAWRPLGSSRTSRTVWLE